MNYFRHLFQTICCSEAEASTNNKGDILRKIKNKTFINVSKTDESLTIIKRHFSEIRSFANGAKVDFCFDVNKKILLLDLDRTLIFYSQQAGFSMRPNLKRFLQSVSAYYTIFIFTAATQRYLQLMMRYMRQNQGGVQYISGYLTRKNCIEIRTMQEQEIYIKDISIINNCSPEKIIIVDDNPVSYLLNPQNAIPIIPFEGGNSDNHLFYLLQTLKQIRHYSDVRKYIQGRFSFKSFRTTVADSASTIGSLSPHQNKENVQDN